MDTSEESLGESAVGHGDKHQSADVFSTSTGSASLWTVDDAAKFLRKSPRWLFGQLNIHEDEQGSIPHVRLGRSPRFIPQDLMEWAAAGFPPASAYYEMKDAEKRRRGRN